MNGQQLTFDLAGRAALGREAFFESPSNATALAMIDRWKTWPDGKLALCGSAASGKTHLAHVWAAAAQAVVIDATRLTALDIPTLASATRIAVEDVPRIAGHRGAEAALFHLHNLVLGEGGRLLLTGREAPARWPIGLPDLASRMQATTLVRLDPPDDELLAALLAKHMRDRRLPLPGAVAAYLVPRMERSAEAARRLAAVLDQASLSLQRPITVPLARDVLATLQPEETDGTDDAPPAGG